MIRGQRTAGLAILAIVLLIGSVFVMMTAGAGDRVLMGERQASRAQYHRRTNYAAYGCMQLALDKLTSDLTYSIDPVESGIVPNDQELTYELSIYNNYLGNFTNPAPDGRWVPKYMVYIKAKCDFREYPGKYTSTMFSKGYVGGQASDYAIVGTEQVTLANGTVDSWWIREKEVLPYGTRKWLIPSVSGRITTNSIQDNGILIYGPDSVVNASLKWGPSGNEASVLNITDGAQWNPTGSTYMTKAASTFPVRVPRFHPPRDPKFADTDYVASPVDNILPNDYKSLTIINANVTLNMPASLPSPPNENKFYVANNVTISNSTVTLSGASAAVPCDIYVGRGFHATNSIINWSNTPSQNLPPDKPNTPHPAASALISQEVLGPRTLRIFFVGSGAPKFKDCNFSASNCTMSLHASGKAMEVGLTNNTILWGGVKGFKVTVANSTIHYHRVFSDD